MQKDNRTIPSMLRRSLPQVLLVSLLLALAAPAHAQLTAAETVSYPPSAVSGSAFTYHVTFTNTSSTGGQVEYLQSVPGTPAGAWWIDGVTQTSGPPFHCSFVPRVDCFLDDFAPGATAGFDVTLHTDPSQFAPIDVRNSLIATTTSTTAATDTHTVPLAQVADFVTNITGATAARLGDDVPYFVSVLDNGPSAAGGTLTIAIPAGLAFASYEPGASVPQCTTPPVGSSGTMSCTFGMLVPAVPHFGSVGLGASLTLHVKPVATGTMTISASAAASFATDPNLANNDKSLTVEATEFGQSELAVTLHADKTTAVVNAQTVAYDAAVTNNGPSTATNVKLAVTIPSGATLAATPFACSGTPLVCVDTLLAPGKTVHWTYYLRFTTAGDKVSSVSAASDSNDVNPSNSSASATVSARIITGDLRVAVTPTKSSVNPGDEVYYYIVVANNGPDTVPQATLTMTLPAGSMLTASWPGCAQNGNAVTCTFANLTTTGAISMQLAAAAPPSADPFAVTFAVSSSAPDPDPSNNSVTLTAPVTGSVPAGDADVRLTVTAEPTVPSNGLLHFVMTATNYGPSTATNVTAHFQIAGTNIAVTNVEPPPNANIKCITYGDGVSCAANSLVSGEFFFATITVSAGGGSVIVAGTGRAASGTHDPNLSNNVAAATPVIVAPVLSVAVNPPSATLTLGQSATHTITVSNSGGAAANPLDVSEQWTGGFFAASVTASAGTCTTGNSGFTCNAGTLAAGAQMTVTVTGTATAPGTWSGAIQAFVPLSGGISASTAYALTVTSPPHHRASGH